MLKSARSETDYSADDLPLVYSREYYRPDAFDFILWRRSPTGLNGAAWEGAT